MKIIKKLINVLTALIIIIGGIFLGLYIYGIIPYVVLSGSMEPKIKTGSLCFVNKNIKLDNIKKDDIIAFKLGNGTLVTHRVLEVHDTFVKTKGDNNKNEDGTDITKDNYIGKNIYWVPKLGYVVKAFQSLKGKIILVSCVILLFISGLLFGEDKQKIKENIKK